MSAPIGIFDSGIGGLTVAAAVSRALPNESFVYFGDTAHLPYGDKSTSAIQAYSVKITDMLIRQQVKVVLIACNSASAAAYELVREYTGSKAVVINVIDPTVTYIGQHFAGKKVGLIGTKQTVSSNVYRKKIDALGLGIELQSLATPLLAPMIEEGFYNNTISRTLIHEYLDNALLEGIEALILGCTHYPLIKPEIEAYYEGRVQIIDSSDIVSQTVKNLLAEKNMAAPAGNQARQSFFVSDYTDSFLHATRIFFGQEVKLQHYPLWD